MTFRLALTALLLGFVSFASAQNGPKSSEAFFGKNMQTAKQRGLDSLHALHPLKHRAKAIPEKHAIESKSASSFTARLDSMVHHGWYKYNFTYDAEGNNAVDLLSYWTSTEDWMAEEKVEIAYNEANLPEERIEWYLNFLTMELQMTTREVFTYQENGLIAETAIYTWNDEDWVLQAEIIYDYDELDHLLESTIYEWDATTEGLEAAWKQVFMYTDTGELTEILFLMWNGSEWMNQSSELYTLNSAGLVTEILYSFWNANEEVFLPQAKDERVYDDSGRLISETFAFWNESESDWTGGFRDTFEYDDFDNVATHIFHSWEEDLMDYVPAGQTSLTYDHDYLLSETMIPAYFSPEFYYHIPLSLTFSEWVMEEWIESETADLYYTLLDITSVNDLPTAPFAIYPNPFHESIRFSGPESPERFTLFDLQGRVVLQKQMAGALEVSTGHLPAGMYVYRVEGMHSSQTGKLVKE